MNLSLYLARKIYGTGDEKHKVSRPAIKIATLGVAIGIAIMIIAVSVVFGFKNTIRDKVVGFGGHIQVSNFMTQQSSESYPILINDSLLKVLKNLPGVKFADRFSMTQGIIKTKKDFLGITFKGVGEEWNSSFIHKNLKEGVIPRFSSKSNSNNILISRSISDKLNLSCGERIFAYFINNDGVRMRRFKICGIYETNLSQFDDVICFIDLYTSVKLNGWEEDQALGAEISVDNFEDLDFVEDNVVNTVNRTIDKYGSTYSSKTIKELNPQIFAWLDLLDMNVWIILALMVLVASVTMVSGLLIIILERTNMIGTLKALGARNNNIRHTFLWFGIFILSKGIIIGDIIGIGLIFIQKYFGIVHLNPQTYYVNTVPVEINIPLFVLINLITLIINILVLVIPSYLIYRVNPSKTIRFE